MPSEFLKKPIGPGTRRLLMIFYAKWEREISKVFSYCGHRSMLVLAPGSLILIESFLLTESDGYSDKQTHALLADLASVWTLVTINS